MTQQLNNHSNTRNHHNNLPNTPGQLAINGHHITPSSAAASPAASNHARQHHPPFPLPGSLLAGRYLVLSRLGRGTFCSIHKCVDLSYHHLSRGGDPPIVAAKIELSSFSNSGVLEGEAMVLRHLHQTLDPGTVPTFREYVRCVPTIVSPSAMGGEELEGGGPGGDPNADERGHPGGLVDYGGPTEEEAISAIIMEYLPGEDMARLRDRHCQAQRAAAAAAASTQQQIVPPSAPTRRIRIRDAVYLCADVMLPLLKNMHDTGCIHRDVKPSNCVRVGINENDRKFKIVDFGLSKSFVVPKSSGLADLNLPWNGIWQGYNANEGGSDGTSGSVEACQRKERPRADFRGTSMYASLRVHQLRDYCRRDDIFSLMYVFCDFLSGGLPWMTAALQRDRELCRRIKERIHDNGNAHVVDLLYGPLYHRYIEDMERMGGNVKGRDDEGVGLRVKVAQDSRKVEMLRVAFRHLCGLNFGDEPDYALIERCIRGFLPEGQQEDDDDDIPPLDWNMPESKKKKKRSSATLKESQYCYMDGMMTSMTMSCDDEDPWETALVEEIDPDLILKARVAKAEYNARNATNILSTRHSQGANNGSMGDNASTPPSHLLTDWLSASLPLVYGPWDVTKCEKFGAHRHEDDGYRREEYVRMIDRCLEAATPYGFFMSKGYFELERREQRNDENEIQKKRKVKRLKMMDANRAILGLRSGRSRESGKPCAPPPAISFAG